MSHSRGNESHRVRHVLALHEDGTTWRGDAIRELDESTAGRVRNVGRHVNARADIKKQLRRGRRAVDMLDTIVRVAFEGQDGVLAEWDVAKRVQSLPVSSIVAEEQPVIGPETKLSAA